MNKLGTVILVGLEFLVSGVAQNSPPSGGGSSTAPVTFAPTATTIPAPVCANIGAIGSATWTYAVAGYEANLQSTAPQTCTLANIDASAPNITITLPPTAGLTYNVWRTVAPGAVTQYGSGQVTGGFSSYNSPGAVVADGFGATGEAGKVVGADGSTPPVDQTKGITVSGSIFSSNGIPAPLHWVTNSGVIMYGLSGYGFNVYAEFVFDDQSDKYLSGSAYLSQPSNHLATDVLACGQDCFGRRFVLNPYAEGLNAGEVLYVLPDSNGANATNLTGAYALLTFAFASFSRNMGPQGIFMGLYTCGDATCTPAGLSAAIADSSGALDPEMYPMQSLQSFYNYPAPLTQALAAIDNGYGTVLSAPRDPQTDIGGSGPIYAIRPAYNGGTDTHLSPVIFGENLQASVNGGSSQWDQGWSIGMNPGGIAGLPSFSFRCEDYYKPGGGVAQAECYLQGKSPNGSNGARYIGWVIPYDNSTPVMSLNYDDIQLQSTGASPYGDLNATAGLTLNNGHLSAPNFATATNCSSAASPAVCGSASAGAGVIAAAATTVTINTTAVTANSDINITRSNALGTRLTVTCNTQSSLVVGTPRVTAIVAGTSFTVGLDVGPTANPLCFTYDIKN